MTKFKIPYSCLILAKNAPFWVNLFRPTLAQMQAKNSRLWSSIAPNLTYLRSSIPQCKNWILYLIILVTAIILKLYRILFLLNLAVYHRALVRNFWYLLWLYKLTLVPKKCLICTFFYIQEFSITCLMVIQNFDWTSPSYKKHKRF